MTPSLTELADLAENHARRIVIQANQGLRPSFLFVTASNQIHIVVLEANFDDHRVKQEVAERMRAKMRQEGAIAYSFMGEAWMALRSVHDPEPENVRDLPDKIEVVSIVAHDDKGNGVSRMLRIVRDAAGKATDLTPEEQEEQALSTSGRFSDLLLARA